MALILSSSKLYTINLIIMRVALFLILSLLFFKASGPQENDLKQYPVKKGAGNASFSKEFSRITASYAHNFAELKNDDRSISIIDTVYHPKLNFTEKNDPTLTFEKSDINLSVSFRLDATGVKKVFNELCNALPPGFVYTREYDAAAKISNYTFFRKSGPSAGYPEKIYLQTDVNNTAVLGILKYR